MSGGLDKQSRDKLTERSRFKAWCRVSVRYNDLDPLGHVNNAAMAIFLEEARCQLIAPRLKAHRSQLDMVLASTAMDYRRELHYPGDVEIGTIATRIGSKSFSLAHGVFQDGVCAGTAELVLVVFDLEQRTPVEPPQDVRAFITSLMEGVT
jgi:acyl-CoA thioester hydrolase